MAALGIGSVIAERYRLESKLGEGGMGTVWAADDTKLRRPVAIKMVAAHVSHRDAIAKRFEREAMAVARLKSPHIIEMHDYGVFHGNAYMVMELLEGEPLSRRLSQRDPVSLGQAARWALQLGRALATAHAAGIVHRDLKPANVFLVRHQEEESIKVIDFGIAKALTKMTHNRKDLTTEGSLLGTPRYMAPEQLRGASQVDHRADLWSVAVILYRAVTGRTPFDGDHPGQIIGTILVDPPDPPTQLRSDLPAQIDAFFERALAKDPADRFQDAREMVHAFAMAAGVSDPSFPDPSGPSGQELGDPADPTAATTTTTRMLESGGAADNVSIEAETLTLPTKPEPKRRTGLLLGAIAALVVGGGIGVAFLSADHGDRAADGAQTSETTGDSPAQVGDISPPDKDPWAITEEMSANATAAPSSSAAEPDAGSPAEPAARAAGKPPPRRPEPAVTKAPSGKGKPAAEPKQPKSDSDLFSSPW